MDVGTTLRTARERLGLSREALAERTRIGPAFIRAIEENRFERLPRGIAARGFLRACARELGLDPEPLVRQFIEDLSPPPAADNAQPPAPAGAWAAPELEAPHPGRTLGTSLVLAVVLVAGFAYLANRATSPPAPPPFAGLPVSGLPDDAPVDAVAPTGGRAEADAVTASGARAVAANGSSRLRVEIAPQGPCWVEIRVDGQLRIYRLMHAGERESFDVREQLAMRVGDPSAFGYTINGRPGRPLGRPGVPATAILTPDSWEPFLAGR
jgi:cytoskeleton protein RodZ